MVTATLEKEVIVQRAPIHEMDEMTLFLRDVILPKGMAPDEFVFGKGRAYPTHAEIEREARDAYNTYSR